MLHPALFTRPLTYISIKHPRLGERNVEQRPTKPAGASYSPTRPDNGGTSCQAA